jgi:hypothetical protein
MTRLRLWLALLVLSATLTQCSSCRENVAPAFLLPPETQSGLGTYACLINGVVWQYKNPTGLNLLTRTSWYYDPNENNGALGIGGVRYDNNDVILDQLVLHADSLGLKKLAFADSTSKNLSMSYYNYQKLAKNECPNYRTQLVVPDTTKVFFRQGKLEVTKLDMQARIISGRFACTFFEKGCDTLNITDGRFDVKF